MSNQPAAATSASTTAPTSTSTSTGAPPAATLAPSQLRPRVWFLAAAIVAIVGLWLLFGNSDQKGRPASSASGPAAPAGTALPTGSPSSHPAAESSRAVETASPDTRRHAAGQPTTDDLAGSIPDELIQRILDQAALTNVPTNVATAARTAAWNALRADLLAGGWHTPRLQAAAVTAPGTEHTKPIVVDVTAIWAARDRTDRQLDRQRSTVRLIRTGQTWDVDRIT